MKTLLTLYVSLAVGFAQITSRNLNTPTDAASNLPQQVVGIDDLLGITVYDAPDMSRSIRVSGDGKLSLPMVKTRIPVAGLLPKDIEDSIAAVLRTEELINNPVVTVSIVEYRSRPISIVGAVKKPSSFQATGFITLLEALAKAEGVSEEAGTDLLVTKLDTQSGNKKQIITRRISLKALIDGADPDLNLTLTGGEEIRIPPAGKIFVVGNVKKPGSFAIRDSSESSVLKALAVSEGLMPYASEFAYIYRRNETSSAKTELKIELAKLMKRKTDDIPLLANDILYIPDRSGKRAAISSLERLLSIGTGLGTAAILISR